MKWVYGSKLKGRLLYFSIDSLNEPKKRAKKTAQEHGLEDSQSREIVFFLDKYSERKKPMISNFLRLIKRAKAGSHGEVRLADQGHP